jgi:hypothetical protein
VAVSTTVVLPLALGSWALLSLPFGVVIGRVLASDRR